MFSLKAIIAKRMLKKSMDRTRLSDKRFCESCRRDHWSERECEIAVKIRRVIAELADVDRREILPEFTFAGQISTLGWWRDYDLYEFAKELKGELGVDISGKIHGCNTTFELVTNSTVSIIDFVRDVVELCQSQKDGRG